MAQTLTACRQPKAAKMLLGLNYHMLNSRGFPLNDPGITAFQMLKVSFIAITTVSALPLASSMLYCDILKATLKLIHPSSSSSS